MKKRNTLRLMTLGELRREAARQAEMPLLQRRLAALAEGVEWAARRIRWAVEDWTVRVLTGRVGRMEVVDHPDYREPIEDTRPLP